MATTCPQASSPPTPAGRPLLTLRRTMAWRPSPLRRTDVRTRTAKNTSMSPRRDTPTAGVHTHAHLTAVRVLSFTCGGVAIFCKLVMSSSSLHSIDDMVSRCWCEEDAPALSASQVLWGGGRATRSAPAPHLGIRQPLTLPYPAATVGARMTHGSGVPPRNQSTHRWRRRGPAVPTPPQAPAPSRPGGPPRRSLAAHPAPRAGGEAQG